jgi:hypothetical protein
MESSSFYQQLNIARFPHRPFKLGQCSDLKDFVYVDQQHKGGFRGWIAKFVKPGSKVL